MQWFWELPIQLRGRGQPSAQNERGARIVANTVESLPSHIMLVDLCSRELWQRRSNLIVETIDFCWLSGWLPFHGDICSKLGSLDQSWDTESIFHCLRVCHLITLREQRCEEIGPTLGTIFRNSKASDQWLHDSESVKLYRFKIHCFAN
jgi:hypothetical protein